VDYVTAHTPTGGSNWESCAMGESLTPRRRVWDEGLRVVNHFCQVPYGTWRISTR